MARNGSGVHSLPAGNPVVSGTTISSTVHNATMSDISTALTQSLAKDGQTVPTADLPMGSFKHTGVANATARNQYATVDQVQDGDYHLLGSVSGTNTIVGSLSPSITAYVGTMRLLLPVANTNTAAATINVNGVGAVPIQYGDGSALTGSELVSGTIAELLLVAAANAAIIVNPNVLKSRGHEVGFRSPRVRLQTGNYTTVATDAGTWLHFSTSGAQTITCDQTVAGGIFGSGLEHVINFTKGGSGSVTLKASGAANNLLWYSGAGISTGDRTIAFGGAGTIVVATDVVVVTGAGIS